MPSAVAAHVRMSLWGPAGERRVATCLRRWRALPLAEIVPFHSTEAAGSKLPRKLFGRRFEIVLEGSNIFKKRIGLGYSRKRVARDNQSPNFNISRSA
jgi:hypothetical protein